MPLAIFDAFKTHSDLVKSQCCRLTKW